MKCSECGTTVAAGVLSCRNCGAPLRQRALVVAEPAKAALPPAPDALTEPLVTEQPRRYSLDGLARCLTVLLGLQAGAMLVGLVVAELGYVVFGLFPVIVPVFLVWLYRARRNAEGLGYHHRRSRGWAVGSWFVPVVNLWFPYQVVADSWRARVPSDRHRAVTAQIAAWWAAWIAAWLTGFRPVHTSTVDAQGNSFESYGIWFYLGSTTLSVLFLVVAAILLIIVVNGTTKSSRQEGRPSAR